MFVVPRAGLVDQVADGIDGAGVGRGERYPDQDVVKRVAPDADVAALSVGLHSVIAHPVDQVIIRIRLVRHP